MHFVSYIITMRQSRRRTDIAGRNTSFFPDNRASAPAPVASSSRADIVCHTDKIFIPRRPRPSGYSREPFVFHIFFNSFFHFFNMLPKHRKAKLLRSEERRVGKECRS